MQQWVGVEENWDTGFSVNKTSRHSVRNKPITKHQMQHDPNDLRILKQSIHIEGKNSNWNTGNNRQLMFSGCKITFAERRELEMDNGCTTMWQIPRYLTCIRIILEWEDECPAYLTVVKIITLLCRAVSACLNSYDLANNSFKMPHYDVQYSK